MAHTTEIVKTEKLSNGEFVVTIRCCNNPSTDWTHHMAAAVTADVAKLKISLDTARGLCADLHEKALQSEAALLLEQIAGPVTHE